MQALATIRLLHICGSATKINNNFNITRIRIYIYIYPSLKNGRVSRYGEVFDGKVPYPDRLSIIFKMNYIFFTPQIILPSFDLHSGIVECLNLSYSIPSIG